MDNINVKRLEVTHTLIHSVFQMMGAIVYGFGIYMLIERGYSSSVAGICFSLVNLFSLVLTPVISNYLDNTEKITIFDVIIVFSILTVVMYGINYFLDTKCLLLSIVFILGNGLYVLLDPFVNSISSKIGTYGINIPYTSARASGSFSYGIMCAVFGYISDKTSYLSVIIGGIVFSFIVFILGIIINGQFNKIKEAKIAKEAEKEDTIGFFEFISNNVSFLILCLFLTGMFIGYTTTDNFMLLVTENVGGTSKDMGYLLSFKAILEGVAMMAFPLLLKKVKLETSLYITALGFILKQSIITFAPSVLWLYIGQAFQMLSFSLILPGMIEFVNKYLKKREIIRGVSTISMTIGIGSTISSLCAGFICDLFGVSVMNILALGITLVSSAGFCVMLFVQRQRS